MAARPTEDPHSRPPTCPALAQFLFLPAMFAEPRDIGASHEGMPVGASAIGNGGALFRSPGTKAGCMDAGCAMDRLDKQHEPRAFHSKTSEVGCPPSILVDLEGA